MAFKAGLHKARQLLPGLLGLLLLEPSHRAVRKPRPHGKAACRCPADNPSWGPSQQPASPVKRVSEDALGGFQSSLRVATSSGALPADALNIKEQRPATPAVSVLILDLQTLRA